MFTINFKGKPNPKNKKLVKLQMVLYKKNYARVTKEVNITGLIELWDQKNQTFTSNSPEYLNKNKFLFDEKMKYLKVAESWATEGRNWSPVQWSHCFEAEKEKKEKIIVLPVLKMMEVIIERATKKERLKNGHVVTSTSTAKYYKALRNHLIYFTRQKYNRAFSSYYFEDINQSFIEDFLFYLRKNALQKGHNGGIDSYLRKLYGVFYYANQEKIPGANLDIFDCVRLEMRYYCKIQISQKIKPNVLKNTRTPKQ